MAVLGIFCNWGEKRISYAIVEGTKDNCQKIEIDEYKLSEDVGVTSLDHLKEIGRKIRHLCEIYTIKKACIFTPSGWEKPRRKPAWRPPDPMKVRIETAVVIPLLLSNIDVEIKETDRVLSDLGLNRGNRMRKRIRDYVEKKIPVSNNDQRDALAAALSILD